MRTRTAAVVLPLVAFAGFAAALVFGGGPVAVPAALALAITLPLAIATLVFTGLFCRIRPNLGPIAVLAGTFLRMIWSLGAVALLRSRAVEFGTTPDAIAQWTAGFYVLTLAVETLLLWGILSNASRAKSPPVDGQNQPG